MAATASDGRHEAFTMKGFLIVGITLFQDKAPFRYMLYAAVTSTVLALVASSGSGGGSQSATANQPSPPPPAFATQGAGTQTPIAQGAPAPAAMPAYSPQFVQPVQQAPGPVQLQGGNPLAGTVIQGPVPAVKRGPSPGAAPTPAPQRLKGTSFDTLD